MKQATIVSATEYLSAVFCQIEEHDEYEPLALSDLRTKFKEKKNEELMLIPLTRAEVLTQIYEEYGKPKDLDFDLNSEPELLGTQVLLDELAALCFRVQYEGVRTYFDRHPDLYFEDI